MVILALQAMYPYTTDIGKKRKLSGDRKNLDEIFSDDNIVTPVRLKM